jgi:hypothetical protein
MKHDRLKQLIDELGITPANFEKKYLGESRPKNIYNWLKGAFKMKEDVIEKIIEAVKRKHSDFNEDWFKNGKGEMFAKETKYSVAPEQINIVSELERLKQEVEYLKRENTLIRALAEAKGVKLP